MKKGKFGLSVASIAVICFGFGALRQPQSVLLICGFALMAEKDEWLNKQVIQSLLLTITYYLTILVTDWIFGGVGRFFGFVKAYSAQKAMFAVNSFISGSVYLIFIVLSVLAIWRILRGEDAGIPYISKLAGGDLQEGFQQILEKSAPKIQYGNSEPIQAQFTQPVQPQQIRTPSTPPVPPQPVSAQEQSKPAASSIRHCHNCSAPMQDEARFCTECGAKAE